MDFSTGDQEIENMLRPIEQRNKRILNWAEGVVYNAEYPAGVEVCASYVEECPACTTNL